jgi:hypothetical protein
VAIGDLVSWRIQIAVSTQRHKGTEKDERPRIGDWARENLESGGDGTIDVGDVGVSIAQ